MKTILAGTKLEGSFSIGLTDVNLFGQNIWQQFSLLHVESQLNHRLRVLYTTTALNTPWAKDYYIKGYFIFD